MNKTVNTIKIGLIMLVGFLIMQFAASNVFLANSPKVRPNWQKYVAVKIKSYFDSTIDQIALVIPFSNKAVALKETEKKIEELKNTPLIKTAPGVYADSAGKYSVIKLDEMTYKVYTYTINGKTINIKVLSGGTPPTQEMLEMAY